MSEDQKQKISSSRMGRFKGKDNPHWKGGKFSDGNGYVSIYCPGHPYSNKYNYVREHRLVIEKHIGRYLKRDEVVHHINRNKSDNRLENLLLISNSVEHLKLFHKKETIDYQDIKKCHYCKKDIIRHFMRTRDWNMRKYCSRLCANRSRIY